MSDSILARGLEAGQQNLSIDPREQKFGGFQTPFGYYLHVKLIHIDYVSGGDGIMTPGFKTPAGAIDLKKIGEARNALMDIKLTQVQ